MTLGLPSALAVGAALALACSASAARAAPSVATSPDAALAAAGAGDGTAAGGSAVGARFVSGDGAAGDTASLTVSVTAARQTLILGTDVGTTLVVTVVGPGAQQAVPGRTQATVGTVGPLLPRLQGRPSDTTTAEFTAEYRVPQDRRPQSAIVAIEVVLPSGRRAHGTAHMMLPAATDFPLRTSPNASVSLEIAGREFGPRKADAAGNVRVPIVVPPGIGVGRARGLP